MDLTIPDLLNFSSEAVSSLRSLAHGGRYLLRGDNTHGYRVRYNLENKKRENKTCRSLALMERAGLIEYAIPPRNHHKYHEMQVTDRGLKCLSNILNAEENERILQSPYSVCAG